MRTIIFIFCILSFITGCSDKSSLYFNGEVFVVENFKEEKLLVGEKMFLEDIYTGSMAVYDSLLCFASGKYSDYHLYVFNHKTGQKLGGLASKGNGPNDFIGFSWMDQFICENKEIKLWVSDDTRSWFHLLNLTKSIQTHTTCIDSTVILEWRKYWLNPLSQTFALDDNLILAKNQAEKINGESDNYLPEKFHLYKNTLANEIAGYTLYNKPIIPEKRTIMLDNLTTTDRIKPDKDKVAMAMFMFGQINILDIEKGNIKGFRIKDSPDFKEFIKESNRHKVYYSDICVDNQYILGLYSEKRISEIQETQIFDLSTKIIHVFDWNGNPMYKITLDKEVVQIAWDYVGGFLFGKNKDDEVFRYNVSFLKNNSK